MIPRYSRPEMARIWELQNKFAIWQEIEVLACEAQAELGDAASRSRRPSRSASARASRWSASTSSRRR